MLEKRSNVRNANLFLCRAEGYQLHSVRAPGAMCSDQSQIKVFGYRATARSCSSHFSVVVVLVIQCLHSVLDVLCCLENRLVSGRAVTIKRCPTYFGVQVECRGEMLDSVSFVMEHLVEFPKEVMDIRFVRSDILQNFQFY